MLIAFPVVVLTIVFCNYFLDIPIASLVQTVFQRSKKVAFYLSDIPDLLQVFVVIVTIFALYRYLSRARKGINDRQTALCKLIALVTPASYICKSVFKFIFGRIETRQWLLRPDLYGFNWFHGQGIYDGFPSGHMVVVAALAASLWRFYPRYRTLCLTVITLLGLALVATNYHFLGDVIAGGYLGLIIEGMIFKAIAPCFREQGILSVE
jgi:membrane-associated phospholipid phosphatase